MANNFKNTRAYLVKYGNQVEQEIETRLRNNGKIASGDLYDSIRYDIKEDSKKFIISFYMADYGRYVDKGTKPSKYDNSTGKGTGKSPFIKSLMRWCQIRGLPKNAAFPIRRKIWKMGIAPTNFFTIPTTRRAKQFEKGIETAMALDVDQYIKKQVKKTG